MKLNKAETEYLVSLLSAINNKRHDRDADGYIAEPIVGWEKDDLFGNDRLDYRTRLQLSKKNLIEWRTSETTGKQNIGLFGRGGVKSVTNTAFYVRLTYEGLKLAKLLAAE